MRLSVSLLLFICLLNTALHTQSGELSILSSRSSAQGAVLKIVSSEFTVTTGFKFGYFSYQIGGVYSNGNSVDFLHFPLSELKFPLNVGTVQFNYLMKLNNRWRASFNFETNYSSNSGKMEDSDWGVKSSLVEGAIDDPNSLDVFSRSLTELDFKEYSLNFSKDHGTIKNGTFLGAWETFLGFGLSIQDYNFEVFDAFQIYPSTNLPSINLSGKVLIYEFVQISPYLSAQFQTSKKNKFGLSINLSVSPLVRIGDFDNHLRRGKSSDGNTSGWSLKGDISGRLRLSPKLDLFLMIKSQYTKASGWQKQYDTATKAPLFKVKLKHFSLQNNIYIGGKFWL